MIDTRDDECSAGSMTRTVSTSDLSTPAPENHAAAPDGRTICSVALISTYDLGHQPFGLASPATWLREAGCEVVTIDLAIDTLQPDSVAGADLIALFLPMHTATRLAVAVLDRLREVGTEAHLCAYGLYAPANEELLRSRGVQTVIGGEFEEQLVALAGQVGADRGAEASPTVPSGRQLLPLVSLDRLDFRVPDRSGLPALDRYGSMTLVDGDERVVGYTEATRGCKHLCRHCPVVPVYGGKFRVVQRDIVLADIEHQVRAGAQHITFGDPDFLNGPAHAMALVRELHERHPDVTYDVVIKIQHLVDHPDLLPELAATGCVLLTSAVEAFDEYTLEVFDKRHSREDFTKAVDLLRSAGIAFTPTFVAFSPWTTRESYVDFLAEIHDHGLIGNVPPVQYAIRLLVPKGSRLLEWPGMTELVGEFDAEALSHPWVHPDPLVDRLQEEIFALVDKHSTTASRAEVFGMICGRTAELLGEPYAARLRSFDRVVEVEQVPQPSEPWFCCAEPARNQWDVV